MFLSQLTLSDGSRAVAAREGADAWLVPGTSSVRELALDAIAARAEDARRNREMYSKESRSRRITQEDSAQDVPRLLAAVRAVEEVHQKRGASWPHNGGVFMCGADGAIWPCPTIRALTDALEGEG